MCVLHFKALEKCIKIEDEKNIQLSTEYNMYGGNDSEDLRRSYQSKFPRASEKAPNSHMNYHTKKVSTSNVVMPNADAVSVTKHEFPNSCSSRGIGCENREQASGEVTQLTDDTVLPIRYETALNQHHFIAPETSEGSYEGEQIESTCGQLPVMLNRVDSALNCKVCGTMFKRRRYLERHMSIHTGEKPFNCSFCGKKFRIKNEHKMHELRHKGELPQCPVCSGRYPILRKHMLIHSTESYKHVCSICQKACRTADNLKKHMLAHTYERPYMCQDCGGRYKTCADVKVHMKIHIRAGHTREKNHVCSVCGKMFSQRGGLKTHMSIHTGERPYRCETCGKAFAQKDMLITHQRIHSREKPFVCSTCGKGFRQASAFYRHRLIHTGEQPYECSVCKMRFNQSSSMQRHMLTHTGVKPYSCSDCGTRFTQSGGLASHRLRHCPNSKNTIVDSAADDVTS